MTDGERMQMDRAEQVKADLIHQENMAQIKEQAKHCPFLLRALELNRMQGVHWEHAITAVALALSEDRARLVRDLVTRLERSTEPYIGHVISCNHDPNKVAGCVKCSSRARS